VKIGLGRIVDREEDAAPECLGFELLPGCSSSDVSNFGKDFARSGEELCKVLDLPKGGDVLAIDYSSDNFEDPTDDLQVRPNAWAIVTDKSTIVYTCVGCTRADY